MKKSLGPVAQDITAATFHSACVRILRREIERLGYSRSFTIYDTDDSLKVIKETMKALNMEEKLFAPKAVLSAIGRAKGCAARPAEMMRQAGTDYRMGSIAKVYEKYQAALKAADAVDFDDIIKSADGAAVGTVPRGAVVLSKPVPLYYGRRVSGYKPCAVPTGEPFGGRTRQSVCSGRR